MRIGLDEDLLTLIDAAELLPRLRKGQPVHVSTLYRWISRGQKGVRLEALKIGRTLVTSREALQRFFERLSEAEGYAAPVPVRTTNQAEEAEQELLRRGA
jgi:Protein of unknown function (DUF1580)